MFQSFKKLCSINDNDNDNDNGLEPVMEVSMPVQLITATPTTATTKRWHHMANLLRTHHGPGPHLTWLTALMSTTTDTPKNKQFMYLLKIAGSSFIPFQVQLDHALTSSVKDGPIEASTAKYIVQQYIAATGGNTALNSVNSMYAVCQVEMAHSQMHDDSEQTMTPSPSPSPRHGSQSESGAFVLWQMNPNLWHLELVVSDCKVSAGSDGNFTWSQSSWKPFQSSRGPPRPLRRFFQGLDPRSTVNLFLNALCIGEKVIMNEDCFILKLETSIDILKAQSTENTEITHHTIWGYFSQRTGLLILFKDTKLVRMKSTRKDCDQYVYYDMSMESSLEDYRYINGVNIAHYGKTTTTIDRNGHGKNVRWMVEETCSIKEVEFNICCLSMDSFLPPADANIEE